MRDKKQNFCIPTQPICMCFVPQLCFGNTVSYGQINKASLFELKLNRERDRERETERVSETEREREIERQREFQRQRDRETESFRYREREGERERERESLCCFAITASVFRATYSEL